VLPSRPAFHVGIPSRFKTDIDRAFVAFERRMHPEAVKVDAFERWNVQRRHEPGSVGVRFTVLGSMQNRVTPAAPRRARIGERAKPQFVM
jgi:hypothetical protein